MGMDKPRIAVIGAGLMGHGIAYLFATAGHQVRVQDPDLRALAALPDRIAEICRFLGSDSAAAARVTGGADLGWAVGDADYVIEAAPEKLEL